LSEYRLFETANFQRELARLGPTAAERIRTTLEDRAYPALRAAPRQVPSSARLKDWDPPTWRLRIGSYRLFYRIDDEERVVWLVGVSHRKDAYR
jgi:mRNA interferase RelE/StbE